VKSRFGAANIKNFIGVLIGAALIVVFISLIKLDVTGDSGSGLGKKYDYEIDFTIDPNLFL